MTVTTCIWTDAAVCGDEIQTHPSFEGGAFRLPQETPLVKKTIVVCLAVLLGAAASGMAQDSGNAWVGAGFMDPKDIDSGVLYLAGGFRLNLGKTIAVEPEVGYWKKSEGDEDIISADMSDTMVGINFLFRPQTDGAIGFYVGGGPAMHFVKLGVSLVGVSDSETKTVFGGQGLAGLDIYLSDPVWLFATARYDFVAKANWEGIGEADVSGFKIYGGVRINF